MIAAAFIVHWRRAVQRAGDHQVEYDLILSRTLVEIFSEPALVRALAFRGGTARHKLFLPAPLRYSDDIDLVQVAPGPIGDLIRALRGRLDPILGAFAFERSPISLTAVYRFRCEIPPMQPLRLTVEINTASPSACWASTSVCSEWRALVHRERRRRDLPAGRALRHEAPRPLPAQQGTRPVRPGHRARA